MSNHTSWGHLCIFFESVPDASQNQRKVSTPLSHARSRRGHILYEHTRLSVHSILQRFLWGKSKPKCCTLHRFSLSFPFLSRTVSHFVLFLPGSLHRSEKVTRPLSISVLRNFHCQSAFIDRVSMSGSSRQWKWIVKPHPLLEQSDTVASANGSLCHGHFPAIGGDGRQLTKPESGKWRSAEPTPFLSLSRRRSLINEGTVQPQGLFACQPLFHNRPAIAVESKRLFRRARGA